MVDDVLEVGRDKTIVNRYYDGADGGNTVKGLEEVVTVWAKDGNSVAFSNPQAAEGVRELIGASTVLRVGKPLISIDDRLFGRVQLDRPIEEVADQQRNFHLASPLSSGNQRTALIPGAWSQASGWS